MIKILIKDIKIIKNYLRVDHDDDDEFIFLLMPAAKTFIENYLNRKLDDFDELPEEFNIAFLNIISHWYEKREMQPERSGKELNYLFSDLLDSHRIFQVE